MTKETIGSIEKSKGGISHAAKLDRNYRSIDGGTIAAMKQYFGIDDYDTLFKVIKEMGLNDSSSFSKNPDS
ncbi:MAG TPA: hypothetical protein VJP79_02605 [Nitrososphaera sp.]|nr:hypothetical protein [Nitrososphaera sp.]